MNEEIMFRNIFERIKVPVFVINIGVTGDFIFSCINPAFEEATGYRKEDVIGKRLEEISCFSTESSSMLRNFCQRCLEGVDSIRFDWPLHGGDQEILYLTQLESVRDKSGKIVQIVGSSMDITQLRKIEKEQMVREHLANLKFFESMDKINRAIQGAVDIEEMMKDLLDVVITIFDCDRAYLLYPCDPESPTWTCPMERNKPEYPGVLDLKIEIPMDRQVAETLRILLAADGPVIFGPGTPHALPEDVSKQFDIKSFMSMAIYPKTGSPWQFGIHQCSHAREWTDEEKKLFEAIGRRMADSLSTLLSFRDLRKNEEFLDKVVEHIPNMLFVKDAQTLCFVRFNKAGELLLGYSREEMLGKSAYDFFPKEMADFYTAKDRLVLGSKELVDIPEETLLNKKNEERILHTTKIPILDETGASQYLLGISEDITERRQAEEALRHSEEQKSILNQIANVFLTIPDDAIYGEVLEIVLQVMKSKFGIFGYIAENGDIVSPSLTREVWDECQVPDKSIVFPTESWGNSLWGRAIREKKTFCSDGPFRTPLGHIHIDHFMAVPIIYMQEPIGLISVANKEGGYLDKDKDLLERIASSVSPILHARLQRDVQEQRRMAAERDLKESEEKYRLLITNAGEAIFIIQDEVVKFPNPKTLEMTGYSTEELAEIHFVDLIHPGEKNAVFEGNFRMPEGEQRSEACPFRIIDKKGKEMWVQLTTAPIVWEKKPGILCFLRDITEQKKLEAQFVQVQKMEAVGRLAGGVAHDFNNMLTVIMGHTELSLKNIPPLDPLHHQLGEINKAARRSADLTRQLLAFARKQTIAPRILNLNAAVSGMLNMLRRLIGEDIKLVWKPGVELWPVKMDSSQIDQVLANLCVNARDAISGVGEIIVETRNLTFEDSYCARHVGFVPGDYVLIAVSDDGCGMDEATQAHLFEPFFTSKGLGKGTGLGLATVHGIVKQNDGFINVYSEPGQGTTFKIYFPRHKAEPDVAVVEIAPEASPARGETILMVEDEKAIVELGESILEESGYMVLTAQSPNEAIRLVEEYTGDIHLLLTDVVMPEMNGPDLAARLTAIKPGLKCLYMSGYTANIIAHRGVLEKGVYFIHKPFSVNNLIVKVREVLDQKSTDGNIE